MPRVGLVVGNGFAIDFCQMHLGSLYLPNPSDPFHWEFKVPDEHGLSWQLAFPLLNNIIDSYDYEIFSFELFRSMLAQIKSKRSTDSRWLDAEARQFLAFAYSVFQEQVDRFDIADWRWRNWLAKHSQSIAMAVSFNYDRVLETAAASTGFRLTPFAIGNRFGSCTLLKPHGSIDFECYPGIISVPKSTYPLSMCITLNDTPIIALDPKTLRQPRQEAFIVLPAETSPYLDFQWVAPGYQEWSRKAGNLTHCVLVGLSYWECDRKEIDFLLNALPPTAVVVLANPHPHAELVARIKAQGKQVIVWADGPQEISNVA